jgi:hypothetical protein
METMMIIFTNRHVTAGTDEKSFGSSFTPGSTRLAYAHVSVDKNDSSKWVLSDIEIDINDADFNNSLLPLFGGSKPVLVYIHGNNNNPAKCFERCALLESLYGLPVIGFSWASEGYLPDGNNAPDVLPPEKDDETDLEGVTVSNKQESKIQGKIRRYQQAKLNAQNSVDALARFLSKLGAARLYANQRPFSLAAHSLGVHFLQYALNIPGATESLATAHNVALLAGCVRASGHRDWLAKVHPKGQVFVAFNKSDSVLFAASIVDGGQIKLGAEPSDFLQLPFVRYISFTNSKVGVGGHRYFALEKMPKKSLKVFTRIFGSEQDIRNDENPGSVYPVGCDGDHLICYMQAP